jgi:hypothetical protein
MFAGEVDRLFEELIFHEWQIDFHAQSALQTGLAENILLEAIMLLRDHPLLTYQNSRSWPPPWLYCGGFDNTHPLGEVGILRTVYLSVVKPSTSCSLVMEHAGAEYMGTLFVSDAAFCLEIYAVLLRHCNKTIQEIGDIHLSDTRQVSDIYPHQPPPPHPAFLPARRPGMKF